MGVLDLELVPPGAGVPNPASFEGCSSNRGWYPAERGLVNRFFRSALFPLVIIAALVWLALQTLGGQQRQEREADPLTGLQQNDRASGDTDAPVRLIQEIVFSPNKNAAERHTSEDGKKAVGPLSERPVGPQI